jgi:anti-sigma B factor antagonist
VASLKSKEVDGVLIVGFGTGKLLDEAVIQQTGKELVEIVGQASEKKLLLTFHNVSYMSSAMLGRLVMFLKKCQQEGVDLKVCSIDPSIAEIFKITNLNKMFDIQKDEQKALDAFQKKKGWFG